jgi:hypothetical protein
MGTKNKTPTLRQRCALYIVDNPGSSMTDILTCGGRGLISDSKAVCKALKGMVDDGELVREGTLKNYTYSAPAAKPSRGRKGIGNKSNVLRVKQTWLHAGTYESMPFDVVRFRDIWSYAETFVT